MSFAEDIEKKILQYYREPTEALNNFLNEAQSTQEAMVFSWQLLEKTKPMEVQFYGANTLYFKISKQWHQAFSKDYSQFYRNFMQLMRDHANNEVAITSKICACISCFVLQTLPTDWPTAINDLTAEVVNPQDKDEESKILTQRNLLEILTALPEEYPGIILPLNNRSQVASILINNSRLILAALQHILGQKSAPDLLKLQSLMCFTSWINFGMNVMFQEAKPVVFMIFDHLRTSTYFYKSVEALTRLFNLQSNTKNSDVMFDYLQKVVELSPLFNIEEDTELINALTKLIVAAAERNANLIIRSFDPEHERKSVASGLFEIIFKTASINPSSSLNFWFNLQDELLQTHYFESTRRLVSDEFTKMLKFLTEKAQYPSDNEYDSWSFETKNTFRSIRQDLADAAAYFSENRNLDALSHLVNLLEQELMNLGYGSVESDWQKFESLIYLMTSIVDVGKFWDYSTIKKLHDVLTLVPRLHIILDSQMTLLMGSYAREMDSQMFQQSVDFILALLKRYSTAHSAALISLNKLLRSHEKDIAVVSERVYQGLNETMMNEHLQATDYFQLANCLGYVVSAMPKEQATQFNEVFVHYIRTCINQNTSESVNHVIRMLDGFFMTFSVRDDGDEDDDFIDSSHSIFQFLEQLFPCVKQIISLYADDESVMKEVCEMLKDAVASLSCYIGFALAGFCDVVAFASNLKLMPCIFDLTKSLYTAICKDKKLTQILQPTFNCVRDKSLHIMEHDFANNLDIVECSMKFFTALFTRYESVMITDLDASFKLFWFAMRGIDTNDINVSKASCECLSLLIMNDNFAKAVEVHGRKLLETIVLAVAVTLPITNLHPLADIIMALQTKHFSFAKSTLKEILFDSQFPVPQTSAHNSNELFVEEMFQKTRSKLKIKELFRDFAKIWRNI